MVTFDWPHVFQGVSWPLFSGVPPTQCQGREANTRQGPNGHPGRWGASWELACGPNPQHQRRAMTRILTDGSPGYMYEIHKVRTPCLASMRLRVLCTKHGFVRIFYSVPQAPPMTASARTCAAARTAQEQVQMDRMLSTSQCPRLTHILRKIPL